MATATFTPQTLSNPSQRFLLLAGQEKRIWLTFASGEVAYDPFEVNITIYKTDSTTLLTDTYSASPVSTYVKKSATGVYYIDFTSAIYGVDNIGDYQFVWSWRDTSGGELFNGFQTVFVAPIQVWNLFPYLRNQIDKSQKDANVIFGYTDAQLYLYVNGGLGEINRVPPQTSFTLRTFPKAHQQLLVDISTFVALVSQSLLAVDTDVNYSMQGNSMSIDHFAKYSTFLSGLRMRADTGLLHFKLNYMQFGRVKVERGPGFRSVNMWTSSPSGISFGTVLGVR